MKKIIFACAAILVFFPSVIVYAAYTGPGNRTNISADVIVRTQCLSTQYDGGPVVWRYRDWDNIYAAPGSATALFWQAQYLYAPEHTHCHSGLDGQYGWGQKTVSVGAYDPVSTSHTVSCGIPGNSGWCRGDLNLNLSASEPIPGYVVRFFETSSGVMCDPADAATVNCMVGITQQGSSSNDYWAVSSYGDTSLQRTYSWALDSVAPLLSSSASNTPPNEWYSANVNLNLAGTDATSGVNASSYRYRINGAAWQNGADLAITVDGVYTVDGEVQDVAGNVGTRNITIRMDKTPPTASPVPVGMMQNGWYRTTVETAANAADATSGVASVEHSINGGAWQNGGNVTVSSDGTHAISFRIRDNAGHVIVRDVTFSVDRTPPSVVQTVPTPGGTNSWHTADVSISLAASDTLSGLAPGTLRYRIGGGSWVTGNSLALTADGTHTIEARADDLAGNTRTIIFSVPLDKTPPTLSTFAPGGWINASGAVSATAGDATSGLDSVTHRVNGGAWQAGTDASIAIEGVHDVEFRATDNAGLVTTRSTTIRVDLTPPSLSASPTPDGLNGWYITSPTIPLSALDALSGVASGSLQYRWNSLDWTMGDAVSVSQDGTHIVEARVNDLAGNTDDTAFEVWVDTVAPALEITVTSDMPQQNGWYVEPATATAFASDTTSGVARVEYQVSNMMAAISPARAGRFRIQPQSGWLDGSTLTLEDGDHLLTMRATDVAGHATDKSQTIRVDRFAPITTFAPVSGPLSGVVSLHGNSTDTTSGVALVQYSLDDGHTWQTIPLIDGNWKIPYDTTLHPDGSYSILVRAIDNAGNIETPVSLSVTVNNSPPEVSISESWWIWESGKLSVRPGAIPLDRIHLVVACKELPDVTLVFNNLSKLPGEFTWNRRCGGGILAEPGAYQVTLTACNIYGKCASDAGIVRIPDGQVVEDAKTAEPVPTSEPTSSRLLPTPTAMPVPVIFSPVDATLALAPPLLHWPIWLLPLAGLFGLVLALGLNYFYDPRPQAIRSLGNALAKRADE